MPISLPLSSQLVRQTCQRVRPKLQRRRRTSCRRRCLAQFASHSLTSNRSTAWCVLCVDAAAACCTSKQLEADDSDGDEDDDKKDDDDNVRGLGHELAPAARLHDV